MIGRIRRVVYKAGFRPKQGSPFYSPSLALIYGAKESFVHLKGTDFDGDTVLKLGEMKPISIFGPDQMTSRHPDIPDQEKWMALNEGPIEPYSSPLMDLAKESGVPYTDLVYASMGKIGENFRRWAIVTSRKHGRTQAMMKEIEHNLRYGKGSVAYIGPGMTIRRRPNPWPVGTDAWHLWNLRGNAYGHAETHVKGHRSDEWVMMVYTAGQFVYDAQKAANDVRTVREMIAIHAGLSPDEVSMAHFTVPEELLEDQEDDE